MADAEYFKLDDGTVLAVADATARQKIGSDTLDTEAQDLSGAVNELKGTLTGLIKVATHTCTCEFDNSTNGTAIVDVAISGYTPVGLAYVYNNSGHYFVYGYTINTSTNKLSLTLRRGNNDTVTATVTVNATVWYVRNDCFA